ncbi:elongation factor ts, mitochondrial [Plakobranchus ocellatus]|uniref:Elongation factor Ts, mitochondrial n=1 Tax=Plakobranchus ocellatus TaxID=259542 RepID=A0AAV4C624_9GAST|nr:elongation factor ts, mitochondrial [Plakobranchus ocellatus]
MQNSYYGKGACASRSNFISWAKKWLLEEAQKEGWTRATKLQSRPMSQGLIALLANNQQATMIEVNCETDFVAKNEKFVSMVTKLVEECSGYLQGSQESEVYLSKAELDQIKTAEHGTLADIVSLNIGNLGENMALRRGVFMQATDNNVLSCYVHPSGGADARSLMLGKYGAVLELVPSSLSQESSLQDLGRDLCQHIVGMNPQTVGEYSPPLQIEHSSPSEQHDQGYRSDSGSEEGGESQTQLLLQEFLLDSSMCVGEMLEARGGVGVARFKRFACGEELEGEGE